MESLNVDQRATCPYCLGPLGRRTEGDVGQQIEWKFCGFCGALFGPPWHEHQWTEPTSEPTALVDLGREREIVMGAV
jgi:hypothetical protein